jgi:predicted MFS family arabinose efflux permease
VVAFLLSLGVAGLPGGTVSAAHPWADLKEGFRYVGAKPELTGAFALAFLVNLLAYPFVLGLLPYVAKEVYGAGQAALGYLVAAFWSGALLGSLVVGSGRIPLAPARAMLWNGAFWFAATLLFGQTTHLAAGLALLFAAGIVQSFCLTPLAAVMLRAAGEAMRGRVMGVRMLAIWGLPLGLLAAGPNIDNLGYRATTLLYAVLGLSAVLVIAWSWRDELWRRDAPANARM